MSEPGRESEAIMGEQVSDELSDTEDTCLYELGQVSPHRPLHQVVQFFSGIFALLRTRLKRSIVINYLYTL